MVTIGMPVFNTDRYIAFAIKSILKQTHSNFELIIIDDGSTDNTKEIITSFKDPRIKFFHFEKNLGIASRLNEIIAMAKGKYFARMDADDIMFPNRLAVQVQFLEQHPEFDVIGSTAVVINEKNEVIGLREIKEKSTFKDAVQRSIFIHPSIIGHINWFKNNLYDINLSGAEDYELFLRTFLNASFMNLQDPLLFYRDIAGNDLSPYIFRQKMVTKSLIKHKTLINNQLFIYILIMFINFKSLVFTLSFKLKFRRLFIKFRNSKLSIDKLSMYQVSLSNQCS